MELLVLGGTRHVGRAVVEAALERGDHVTTVNRGITGASPAGVDQRRGDRLDHDSMRAALGQDTWDAVIDTWSLRPAAVRDSARLLRDRAGHYGYVSSRSVHAWPIPHGADESAPTVAADPDSTRDDDYAAAKRGGELAVLDEFGDRCLLARAGMVLGPYESVGRLPWWLSRVARGGQVPAPGPRERGLQYVDARDLAEWMLACADHEVTGAFNVVSEPGHATIGDLLDRCVAVTGSTAELVWLDPATIARHGIEGWTQLPIWTSPQGEVAALHDGDVSAAMAAGLRCRPAEQTVADTWAWMQQEGAPPRAAGVPGKLGLTAAEEELLLGAHDRGAVS